MLVALVPLGVVTVMSTVPVPAGEVAVMDVAEFTVKLVALVAPNFTEVAPVNVVPVTVTVAPPAGSPDDGLAAVTVGAAEYVNRSAVLVALVPLAVVTVMSTVPVPAGDTAVIDVADTTVKLVALVVPNFTAVAAVSVVPVIVTVAPPAGRPEAGLTAVTVGAAMYVN